jgi:hypothetical protein
VARCGLVFFLAMVGCSSSTSLLAEVESGDDVSAAITHATVSVFRDTGLLARMQIAPAPLPGAVRVSGLPDRADELRVVVVGDGPRGVALGGARVTVEPHAEVTTTVTLSATAADTDGDGVPDTLDDCPTVADPDQTGPGDACASPPDLAGLDLAGLDLAGDDLATPDLATADLGTADLARPDLAAPDLATPDLARPDLALPPDLAPAPSLCGLAGALFCDGFEFGLGNWGTIQSSGTVTIDSSRFFRGAASLHVHQDTTTTGATAVAIATLAYPMPDFYIRAYVFAPAGFGGPTVTFLRAQESTAGQFSLDVTLSPPALGTHAARTNVNRTSTTLLPLNRWVCVEWHVNVATSGFMNVSLDGQPINSLSATQDTSNSPPYDWLVIGLDNSGGSFSARDLWLDEVILDGAPIGCAR